MTIARGRGYPRARSLLACARVRAIERGGRSQRGPGIRPHCDDDREGVGSPREPRACARRKRWGFATGPAAFRRGASNWRCPTSECSQKSVWVKASRLHPLTPRETKRWRDLYKGRAAVEREFGRLKHEYGLAPLRVRGLARVQLHADLTMLARLSQALARARAVPLAA